MYKTHEYPTMAGDKKMQVWMVENSREGSPVKMGVKGGYYTHAELLAGKPCPNGWSPPMISELKNLVDHLQTIGREGAGKWWYNCSDGACAGFYDTSDKFVWEGTYGTIAHAAYIAGVYHTFVLPVGNMTPGATRTPYPGGIGGISQTETRISVRCVKK